MSEQSQHAPTRCGHTGYLLVAGRKVGVLRCELDAGHERRRWDDPWTGLLDADLYAAHNRNGGASLPMIEGTPHRATLEWTDEDALADDWPEALDPEEPFDIEVPLVDVGRYAEDNVPLDYTGNPSSA